MLRLSDGVIVMESEGVMERLSDGVMDMDGLGVCDGESDGASGLQINHARTLQVQVQSSTERASTTSSGTKHGRTTRDNLLVLGSWLTKVIVIPSEAVGVLAVDKQLQ